MNERIDEFVLRLSDLAHAFIRHWARAQRFQGTDNFPARLPPAEWDREFEAFIQENKHL